jgi:hypothetical protein
MNILVLDVINFQGSVTYKFMIEKNNFALKPSVECNLKLPF